MSNTIKKILHLCDNIAGVSVLELANMVGFMPPKLSNKGWIGQLLELYLGATGSNAPIVDFPDLGIELKTIPINVNNGQPLESTFVCVANFNKYNLNWDNSIVKLKLSKVLWIPIVIDPKNKNNLHQKFIGNSFLWQPNSQQLAILKQDWQELTELLQFGNIEQLSANYGQYLQIRPKALNCKKPNLVNYLNMEQESIATVSRGFYLRTIFTKQILANQSLKSYGYK